MSLGEKAIVGKACTFNIDAAKAGAGNMEIIVSAGKRNVPNFVQAEGTVVSNGSVAPPYSPEPLRLTKMSCF